jgi:sigma-E factor negative regulatory protein RseB
MNRAVRGLLAAAFATVVSVSASAGGAEDARAWLERMAAAMNHLSYQGTFVYVRSGQLETMRITHVVDDKGIRERLYSVTGPQREIIRDSEGVRCVLGDDRSVMEDPLVSGAIFPEFPIEDMAGEGQAYHFEVGDTARIAGHMGRRVTIVPGDQFRYGYDLWLEAGSGLLLKWVLFDANKNALAKLVFTDLRLGEEIDLDELESDTPDEAFTRLPSAMPARQVMTRANPEWQPEALPPGFRLATHRHQSDGESVFEHLVYSDGLASVSVYIESGADHARTRQGLSRIGTANAFTRTLGSRQLTVIGEVPEATVRAIGDAFKAPATSR